MRSAGTDFVIAPGTAIGLHRAGRADGVLIVIQCYATDAAVDGQSSRLGLDLLCRENPSYRCQNAVTIEQFEIARQLLHAVNLATPLDFHRDRAAPLIATQ